MNSPETPAPSRIEKPPSAYLGAPVVLALTIANVILFGAEVVHDGTAGALMSPEPSTMLALGANYGAATLRESRWETLVTSCFLHYGLLHIGFNMVALRQIGPLLERFLGSGRFALLYLVTGAVGSLASAGWSRMGYLLAIRYPTLPEGWRTLLAERVGSVSAGASGAICGLIGAALVLGIRRQGVRGPLPRAMFQWLLITVVLGFAIKADNSAHLGGAACGALLVAFFGRDPEPPRARRLRVAAVAAAIVLAFVRVAVVSATDPYASQHARDRIKLAVEHARAGRCAEARKAKEAALRVSPEVIHDAITERVGDCVF